MEKSAEKNRRISTLNNGKTYLIIIEEIKMLNERIRQLRTARGISQVELARMLNVTKQSVSNWENDNILPSIEMLIRIARVLSVSSDYLLGLDNRQYLEISGLTDKQLSHIQQIIDDIRMHNA